MTVGSNTHTDHDRDTPSAWWTAAVTASSGSEWVTDLPDLSDALPPRRVALVDREHRGATGSGSHVVELIGAVITRALREFCETTPAPDTDDAQDALVGELRALAAKHGAVTIAAIRTLLASKNADSILVERFIRAVGYLSAANVLTGASQLIAESLKAESATQREAAIAAFAIGADPPSAINALRSSADSERTPLLRSAMLQTAEQLEAWSRRRAVASKDRAPKVG